MAEGNDFRPYQTAREGSPVLLGCGGMLFIMSLAGGLWWVTALAVAMVSFGGWLHLRAQRLRPPDTSD